MNDNLCHYGFFSNVPELFFDYFEGENAVRFGNVGVICAEPGLITGTRKTEQSYIYQFFQIFIARNEHGLGLRGPSRILGLKFISQNSQESNF